MRTSTGACHYCKADATRRVGYGYAAVRGTKHRFDRETCDGHESLAKADALEWRRELEIEDARDNGALP